MVVFPVKMGSAVVFLRADEVAGLTELIRATIIFLQADPLILQAALRY